MTFHANRTLKSGKPRTCEQCGTQIDPGTEHKYSCGVYEGDFYGHRQHLECSAAGQAYASLHGLDGEEWPWFHDGEICTERHAREWMKANHPVVYERLGWAKIDASEEAS